MDCWMLAAIFSSCSRRAWAAMLSARICTCILSESRMRRSAPVSTPISSCPVSAGSGNSRSPSFALPTASASRWIGRDMPVATNEMAPTSNNNPAPPNHSWRRSATFAADKSCARGMTSMSRHCSVSRLRTARYAASPPDCLRHQSEGVALRQHGFGGRANGIRAAHIRCADGRHEVLRPGWRSQPACGERFEPHACSRLAHPVEGQVRGHHASELARAVRSGAKERHRIRDHPGVAAARIEIRRRPHGVPGVGRAAIPGKAGVSVGVERQIGVRHRAGAPKIVRRKRTRSGLVAHLGRQSSSRRHRARH